MHPVTIFLRMFLDEACFQSSTRGSGVVLCTPVCHLIQAQHEQIVSIQNCAKWGGVWGENTEPILSISHNADEFVLHFIRKLNFINRYFPTPSTCRSRTSVSPCAKSIQGRTCELQSATRNGTDQASMGKPHFYRKYTQLIKFVPCAAGKPLCAEAKLLLEA